VEEFNIDLTAFNHETVDIYVIDYYERTMMHETTSNEGIRLNATSLSSGTYLVLVRSKSGKTAASTLLKP
jgi:hypothetical protein